MTHPTEEGIHESPVETGISEENIAEDTISAEALPGPGAPPEGAARHWTAGRTRPFTRAERAHTTLLLSGLTLAHDTLLTGALAGLGYRVEALPVPDDEALRVGKEYGNRGQCNPTWYTVGNLVKFLIRLRDEEGMSAEEIERRYVFLTAGACGPCRFGTYVTEYRKALHDAGFPGFRVLLFQQQGGIKQATGAGDGIAFDPTFFSAVLRALLAGDVLNLLGYRIRPYEVVPGSTDAALAEARAVVREALAERRSVIRALRRAGRILRRVEVDRLQPKPRVAIIGEFWAMTTEGDGNYRLQRFLEAEGAEVHIQPIVNWLLFMIWENRHDTLRRLELKGVDAARKGLAGKRPHKKLAMLWAAERALRVVFPAMARAAGLERHRLPDMDEIARLARDHYDNDVRGGEGHMEVGKVIEMVRDREVHMIVSVKPFGCMPSSGVSDGVQSRVAALYPELVFLPIETTGDGAVNVQSRILMMLHRARAKAEAEYEAALAKAGLDEETARARLAASRWKAPAAWPPVGEHVGTAARLAAALGT